MFFLPLEDILKKKIRSNSDFKRQVDVALVMEKAQLIINSLLSSEIASQIKPLFIKNRTLTLSCSNSVCAQEIRLKQKEIIDNINQSIGEGMVDRIRYLI